MALSLIRRGVPGLIGGANALAILRALATEYGAVPWYYQETSGAVAYAENTALTVPDTRDVALNTYADYTAGANWSNPSGQIARHTAGATATLQQDGILAIGKSYQVTITVANRTAGSITITDGGAAIDGNGQVTRTISSSTGEDFIITPTSDFDGDIDVAILLVQQTNILAWTAYPGPEELSEAGDGTADKDNWVPGNNATLANPSVNLLRIARSITNNPRAQQTSLTVGVRYWLVAEARSDGFATPRAFEGSNVLFDGTTSTNWQSVSVEFVTSNTTINIQSITSTGTEYTEWRNISVTEANPLNADHTGVTVGQPGPAGWLSAEYDAATSVTDANSAELNSMHDPDNWTLLLAAKVSGAGVWTDGQFRTLARLYVDDDNIITFYKPAANNTIIMSAEYNTDVQTVTINPITTTDWFLLSLTCQSKSLRGYLNGTLVNTATLTNDWIGNFASVTIGARDTGPALVWDGFITVPVLFRGVLTDNENEQIAKSLGVYSG
jgi:hypothetical protein